jgi:hypothetical protein
VHPALPLLDILAGSQLRGDATAVASVWATRLSFQCAYFFFTISSKSSSGIRYLGGFGKFCTMITAVASAAWRQANNDRPLHLCNFISCTNRVAFFSSTGTVVFVQNIWGIFSMMTYIRRIIVSPNKFLVEKGDFITTWREVIFRYGYIRLSFRDEKDEPTRTRRVPQRAADAGRRRRILAGAASKHRTPHYTTPVASYPPRFAAPVRPGARTATGLTQPGWPRPHPPTPSTVEPRRSRPWPARSTLRPRTYQKSRTPDRSLDPSLPAAASASLYNRFDVAACPTGHYGTENQTDGWID